MPGLKEICALILAGGVGAGSVVTVQEVRQKPRVERKAPAVKKAVARPAPRAKIEDCPTVVAPLGAGLVPQLADVQPPPQLMQPHGGGSDPFGIAPLPGPGGGGGIVTPLPPGPPSPPPGAIVPEPAAWAMMVSGFGLVGVALRIRPRSVETPTAA